MLTRRVLVLRVLDRDAHLLECEDAASAELARQVGDSQVEVATAVERDRRADRVEAVEVEVLDLRSDEEGVASLMGLAEHTVERKAWTALEGRAIDVDHVAEDPGHRGTVIVEREELEGRGVWPGEDV